MFNGNNFILDTDDIVFISYKVKSFESTQYINKAQIFNFTYLQ